MATAYFALPVAVSVVWTIYFSFSASVLEAICIGAAMIPDSASKDRPLGEGVGVVVVVVVEAGAGVGASVGVGAGTGTGAGAGADSGVEAVEETTVMPEEDDWCLT